MKEQNNSQIIDEHKSQNQIKSFREFQLSQFIDLINTYKSNFPYLIFNSKILIEESLKGLDFRLINQRRYYDIDHTMKFLKEKHRIKDPLINRITELTDYIRRIESGKLPIDYETAKKVLIESASIIIEILYIEDINRIGGSDPTTALYKNEVIEKRKAHLHKLELIIEDNLNRSDEGEIINIVGPVYFYSSGEVSVGRTKRATFIDIENATIVQAPYEEKFDKIDGKKEAVLKATILTASAKSLTLYIWRRWKEFNFSLSEGTHISILGGAVKTFPDYDEIHLLERSLLIIEPDILINATTISEVVQNKKLCLNKYLIKLKKRNVTDSKSALRGIMVGEIIDDYVLQKDKFDFKKSFEKHYRSKLHKTPFINKGFNPYEIYRQISNQLYVIDSFVWEKENPTYPRPQYIEPFYISPRYGLEGRMDMMYLDRENEKLRIYELKSGNAPSSGYPPWDNHSYQTYSYKLIADSVYDYDDTMPYVIYSSSEDPVRDLNYDLTVETIETRNKIVHFLNRLVDENIDSYGFIKLQKDSMCFNCPKYLKSDCIGDYELFKSQLTEQERDYYVSFFKMLELEKHQSRLLTAYLWKKTLAERESLFVALSKLSIETLDNSRIVFRMTKENNSDIRSGDNVYIHRGNPTKEELFRGSVMDIKTESITINLYKEFPVNIERDGWCLDRAYSTSGIDAQHTGLYSFIRSKKRLKDLIFGRTKPEFKKRLAKKPVIDERLNTNQKKAFDLCLKAKDYALIQGPPGTGKTYTIASIVKQLVDEGKKVLITAYTNRAVDNILKTLRDKFDFNDFIRFGSKFNIDPEIVPHTVNEIVQKHDIDSTEELKEEILSYSVYASTTTSAVATLVFDNVDFDSVIVDEAGQMTEPSSLAVITLAPKFLLFGDDKQLPPIVTHHNGLKNQFEDKPDLKAIGLTNLSKSLFERLWKLNKEWEEENSGFNSTLTLNVQYRMNEQIAQISDKYFYNGIIETWYKNKNHTLKDLSYNVPFGSEDLKAILEPLNPLCLINCVNEKISKENFTEARMIYHVVVGLLSGGIKPEQIGIIAPYKAQCALIRKLIDTLPDTSGNTDNIIIDTVERYQGGEKEIIIVSFTVGNETMMRFLSENNEDPSLNRKLNVSITRAKRKLIMLGNADVLRIDKVYREVIYYLESRGLVFNLK
jgi:DNA replication ATP-dependent helicase Dna2